MTTSLLAPFSGTTSTALGAKVFSTQLAWFLGAGWRKRALTDNEVFSLIAARTSVAAWSLEAYENKAFPGIEIQASYSREKKGDAHAYIDVQAFRFKSEKGWNDDLPPVV